MKFNLVTAFVAYGALMSLTAVPPPDAVQGDYYLGLRVGYCLATKCQIFRGYVESAQIESGRPLVVRPTDYIFGERAPDETVSLPYRTPEDFVGGDSTLADLWSKVSVARGTQITVVRALKDGFGARPGEPTLVTSSEREIEIVRSLAKKSAQFRNSPDSIVNATNSLATETNPPLAGLMFVLTCYGEMPLGAEATLSVLSGLLGSSSVPPGAEDLIAAFMTSRYPSLPPDRQAAMLYRLAGLGQQRNPQLAVAAFHALADILRFDHSAALILPPEAIAALGGTYRKMIGEKTLAGDAALDTAFASRTGR